MIRSALTLAAMLLFASATAAQAAGDSGAVLPPVFQNVLKCRAIADDRARLQCFDAGVSQLDTANSHGDIAVVDRAEVDHTRRALFGFTLPSLAIFHHGGGDPRRAAEEDEIKEIDAKIGSVGEGVEGWVITLDDGARWAQSDGVTLGRQPKAGMAVVIRRGMLGSYKMSIGNGPAIKVHRLS